MDTGIITVHNGKGGKDRLVPVHNSVIEYLRSYSAQLPFAVPTLEKQLSDGYDPMVIVPRLAAYLGHKSYHETCWYIHLTVASFPELSQKLDRAFVGIIPVGGETDEEN